MLNMFNKRLRILSENQKKEKQNGNIRTKKKLLLYSLTGFN